MIIQTTTPSNLANKAKIKFVFFYLNEYERRKVLPRLNNCPKKTANVDT